VKALISAFTAANPNARSMAFITSPSQATALAISTNSTTLGPTGPMLFGIPVYTGTVGNRVILLDPSQLLIADEGQLDVTMSSEGTIELDTAATSPTTAGAALVSLWQANLVAFKIDRFISWKMARANSVIYSNVNYQ